MKPYSDGWELPDEFELAQGGGSAIAFGCCLNGFSLATFVENIRFLLS